MSNLTTKTPSKENQSLTLESKKQHFDTSKYSNFVSSSKLEGINITQVSLSLEQLIAKYQTIGNSQDGG